MGLNANMGCKYKMSDDTFVISMHACKFSFHFTSYLIKYQGML